MLLLSCGGTEPLPLAHQTQPIVNGQRASGEYPNVGLLLKNGQPACTATVVGRQTILTAAHCLVDTERAHLTFELDDGVSSLLHGLIHPDYEPGPMDEPVTFADIAVAYLANEVDVPASRLAASPPEQGEEIVLVGYGNTDLGSGDAGTKRWTVNEVEELVQRDLFTVEDASGDEGITCHGDSGGPTFAERRGEQTLIGVHSMGTCYRERWWFFDGSIAWDTRVDKYERWIERRIDDEEILRDPSIEVLSADDPLDEDEDYELEFRIDSALPVARVTVELDGEIVAEHDYEYEALDEDDLDRVFRETIGYLDVGQHEIRISAEDLAGRTFARVVELRVRGEEEDEEQWTSDDEESSRARSGDGGCNLPGRPASLPWLLLLALAAARWHPRRTARARRRYPRSRFF